MIEFAALKYAAGEAGETYNKFFLVVLASSNAIGLSRPAASASEQQSPLRRTPKTQIQFELWEWRRDSAVLRRQRCGGDDQDAVIASMGEGASVHNYRQEGGLHHQP